MVKDFVVIDLETTGLNPKLDKIIEIGAVKIRDHKEVDRFSCFVNPGKKLSDRTKEITGITDEDLQEAPFIEEVFPKLQIFLGDDILMGHNLIFDYSFLKKAAVNQKLSFEKQGVDTLRISRRFLTKLESRRLGDLCSYYQIPIEAHRAFGDAYATYQLYEKMFEEFSVVEEDLFLPKPLIYSVKKDTPITPRQKEHLMNTAARCGITIEDRILESQGVKRHAVYLLPDQKCFFEEVEIGRLTKSEASRLTDHLLSNYGR